MRLFVKNIGTLAGLNPKGLMRRKGAEMSELLSIPDAWLFVTDGVFKAYGSMKEDRDAAASLERQADTVVDAEGGSVLPSFCDSHTHLVFAGSREQEFVDKINGLSYAEIARRGGGILNSADRLHELSEDELFEQSMTRVREIIRKGTGAVEIKSGYGLSTKDAPRDTPYQGSHSTKGYEHFPRRTCCCKGYVAGRLCEPCHRRDDACRGCRRLGGLRRCVL